MGFFLISCILGLGVKVFFATERLTPFLREELNTRLPQFQISFKSVELHLANGLLPAFSFEIKDIEVSYKRTCAVVIPPIRIQKANLPINLLKLFERKFAFSLISVHKIEMDIENFQNSCPDRTGASVALSPAAPLVVEPATKTNTTTPQAASNILMSENVFWDDQRLSKIGEVVSGIEFDEIKFYFDQHQKHLVFKNFNLRQHNIDNQLKASYRLKSEFVLPPEYSHGEVLPVAFIDAELNAEKMNFDISAQISEGHVQIHSVITPGAHSPMIEMNLNAKQLPVSSLAGYLTKLGFLPPNTQPKFVWLNFSALVKGRLDQLKQLPIEASEILVDGEFGQATIAHLVRNADGSLSDFILELTKVQVQKAIELLGTKGPDGIFSQFGELNGQLIFKSAKFVEFKGEWQDAALKFSRHGSRSEQQIENLKISLAFADNRWRGKISNIELENGNFDGEVRLNFDHSFDDGEIEIVNDNLEFDPAVQKSMFFGAVSGVKLNGKMSIRKFLIQSWSGDLQVRSLESDGLSFKHAKLLSHFNGSKLTISAKVAEGEYKYNNEMRKIEKQIFLNFEDRNENLIFTNMKVEITQNDGAWSWKAMKSSLLEDRIQFSSSGDVGSSELLSGEVNLDFPNAKKLVWQFQGNWDSLKLTPISPNLKSLIGKKADFKSLGLNIKE